eukprot:m.353300 g.353300  ORF g.353300 m.353300 type:complete len:179 (+) comp16726_c0_seq1:847-1383(+)
MKPHFNYALTLPVFPLSEFRWSEFCCRLSQAKGISRLRIQDTLIYSTTSNLPPHHSKQPTGNHTSSTKQAEFSSIAITTAVDPSSTTMKVYELIRIVYDNAVVAPQTAQPTIPLSKQLAHHRLWSNLQTTFRTTSNPKALAQSDVVLPTPSTANCFKVQNIILPKRAKHSSFQLHAVV